MRILIWLLCGLFFTLLAFRYSKAINDNEFSDWVTFYVCIVFPILPIFYLFYLEGINHLIFNFLLKERQFKIKRK